MGDRSLRLDWAAAVPGARMCVDIAKFTPSCVAIFEAEGIAIEGLGSRAYGHRSQRSRSKRGGYRPKAEPKTKKLKWCTDSAKPARKVWLAKSEGRHKQQEEE